MAVVCLLGLHKKHFESLRMRAKVGSGAVAAGSPMIRTGGLMGGARDVELQAFLAVAPVAAPLLRRGLCLSRTFSATVRLGNAGSCPHLEWGLEDGNQDYELRGNNAEGWIL